MRKFFSFLLISLLGTGMLFAQSGTWWTFSQGTLTININGSMPNFYEQSQIPWKAHFSEIKSVLIGDSVTEIGCGAFSGCDNLLAIHIPKGITYIGNLYALELPALGNCTNLESITVAEENEYFCAVDGVLFNKDTTTLVRCPSGKQGAYTIPSSVTRIEDNAFLRCDKLTSLTILNNFYSGYGAFPYCSGVRTITLGANVTRFDWSKHLTPLNITFINIDNANATFSSIDGVVFNKDGTKLLFFPRGKQGAYTIPSNVIAIGEKAFYRCYLLTTIDLPDNVTTVEHSAFYQCTALSLLSIGKNVKEIASEAFGECTGLTSIYCSGIIPPTIHDYTFESVDKSIPVHVPLGYHALYTQTEGWKDFTNIVPTRIPYVINGLPYILYGADMSAELTYETLTTANYQDKSKVVIPSSVELSGYHFDVTSIGDSAFYNATSLTSVVIPTSVTSIGDYAFANINTRKFNSIVFPHSVQSIGKNVCANDIYLENIEFGDNMEFIGDSAFLNCSRVMTMTCWSEYTPNVGVNALSSIKSSAELYVRNSCLRKYEMDDNWNRFLLKEIGATETTEQVTDVSVVPEDNTALFTWPTNTNAATYTLAITKDGELFCTLIFNANGQLAGIAFAPGRNGGQRSPSATLVNGGMQFTVTGLDIATVYNFALTTKDASARVLAEYNGQFGTTGAFEAVENIHIEGEQPAKVLHDGQIYILRGKKIYTVTGQTVR